MALYVPLKTVARLEASLSPRGSTRGMGFSSGARLTRLTSSRKFRSTRRLAGLRSNMARARSPFLIPTSRSLTLIARRWPLLASSPSSQDVGPSLWHTRKVLYARHFASHPISLQPD